MRTLVFACLLGMVCLATDSTTSRAHHNATHDQNPSPPGNLSSTDMVTFEAGSIIIPMDGCYARTSYLSGTDLDQIVQVTYQDPSTTRSAKTVSYTHLRAHETPEHLVCRLLLEK